MAASSCTAFIAYLQVEVKYNDHIGSITKTDGSPAAAARPGPGSTILCPSSGSPTRSLKQRREPLLKNRRKRPEIAHSRERAVVCLLLRVPVHDGGHHGDALSLLRPAVRDSPDEGPGRA